MAEYKVVDAEKLDADLVSVADAIREKGGTSDSLEFPQGFVDAVGAIESGGSEIPSKGFVPTEWNSDGRVTKGTLYGMTAIPDGFFMQANNLSEASFFRYLEAVDFKEDIVTFGNSAFFNLSYLLMTELPSTLQSIGAACFRGCSKISFETIPDAILLIDANTFMNCSALKVNKLPPNLTFLGNYAFQNCSQIIVSEIPKGVTNIGVRCFQNCGLRSLTFRGTPTNIATDSFDRCSRLTDIYVPWAEGEVANAPWGATNATIHYNTTYDENGNPIEVEA